METNEKLLDDLYNLQQKRITEIQNFGQDLILQGTERAFKGVINKDQQTIDFLPGTPLTYSQVFTVKGINYFVLSVIQKSGKVSATVAPIAGTAQVLKRATGPFGDSLQPHSEIPYFSNHAGEIVAPRHAAFAAGHLLKLGGELLEVYDVRIDGAKAVLSVRPYQAPQPKSFSRPRPEMPRTVSFPEKRSIDFSH